MHVIDEALTIARAELHAARSWLRDEISTYPTPISGCDAQFNHLLAQRRQIAMALDALEAEVFIPTPRIPDRGARPESR
ncbi:MAG: hypothetical protein AAF919_06825 [Pseudomonadota bacterium]